MDFENESKRKHVRICRKSIDISKKIARKKHPESQLSFYIASHPSSGYLPWQQEGLFWGITGHSTEHPNKNDKLKNPDALVINDRKKEIELFIEVKWGAINDYPKTDINKKPVEKIKSVEERLRICRVIGPAYCKGNKIDRKDKSTYDYFVKKPIFIIVSDFFSYKKQFEDKYELVINRANQLGVKLADIQRRVDDNVPSLYDLLHDKW